MFHPCRVGEDRGSFQETPLGVEKPLLVVLAGVACELLEGLGRLGYSRSLTRTTENTLLEFERM